MLPATMEWLESEGKLRLLDQRVIPQEVCFTDCETCGEVVQAIENMTVRGAPAIGVSAAYGLALAAKNSEDFNSACCRMAASKRFTLAKESSPAAQPIRSLRGG